MEDSLQKKLMDFVGYKDTEEPNYLLKIVAFVCDVNESDVMSNEKTGNYISQVRWLYWYAYRYLTGEPYGRISELATKAGCKYTKDGVRKGVNKIGYIIHGSDVWQRRWNVIRNAIKKIKQENQIAERESYDIVVTIPKELKDFVNVKIIKEG